MVFNDAVNECRKKALEADGFIFGTPVHYAAASGSMTAFMDRLFYSEFCGNQNKAFYLKPAAAVVVARPFCRSMPTAFPTFPPFCGEIAREGKPYNIDAPQKVGR